MRHLQEKSRTNSIQSYRKKSSRLDIRKYRSTAGIISRLKSKIILINFTGIGCGACQAAVPFLKQLKELFTSEEFELIAKESWSRKVSAIRNYANRKELNYTILNATNEVIKQYQTGGAAPYFFIETKNESYEK